MFPLRKNNVKFYYCHSIELYILVVCIWRYQKHDFANYYRFVLNFGMVYKTTKCVSVPNLKSFRPTKTEFQAKEVGEFSVMLYGKMGWGRSLAHQHGCCNITVWRFLKLWTAITFVYFLVYLPESCRDLSEWGYLHWYQMGTIFTYRSEEIQSGDIWAAFVRW